MSAATDLLGLWSSGNASAQELTAAALARIDALNPGLNAIITVLHDAAMEQAREVDRRAARDGHMPPLRGMPVTVKDNVDMAGVRTTMASDFFRDNVATGDAPVVSRLRAAGAVIVGKANLHEFALGATGQSPHFGPCLNPWDASRVPGGSSSGSGASVAAGLCIASIGSDTGGSIRNPAAFNNVAGLKPTHGLVPNRGSFPVSPPHDVLGPLAVRVADVAAVLDAIAGHDPADPTSAEGVPEPADGLPERDLQGLTIGVPRGFYYEDLEPGTAAMVEQALEHLRSLGASTVELDLDGAEQAWRLASRVLVMTDAAALHRERMEAQSQRMGQDVFTRVRVGRHVSGMAYADAMRFREQWRLRVRDAFRRCDAIVTPTCPFPAPTIASAGDMGETSNHINRLNFTWSLAGVPALSVPCGFVDAMPVGLQIVGPWWRDGLVLRIGSVYQQATRWHLYRAPLAMDGV